jgi:DNA-binding transcriptional LysR family regulator
LISTGVHAAWAFGAFARAHAEVALESVSGSPQALCPKLLRGDLDLIVGSSSYLRRWRELEVKLLAPLHVACMFRHDHPLAASAEISEREVLEQPVILPETIEPAYSDLAQRCAAYGLPPLRPRYVASDFELVRRLVRGSDAFFPLMHVSPGFGGLDAQFFLVRGVLQLPPHHLSVAHVASRAPTPAALAFERTLSDRYAAKRVRAAS